MYNNHEEYLEMQHLIKESIRAARSDLFGPQKK